MSMGIALAFVVVATLWVLVVWLLVSGFREPPATRRRYRDRRRRRDHHPTHSEL